MSTGVELNGQSRCWADSPSLYPQQKALLGLIAAAQSQGALGTPIPISGATVPLQLDVVPDGSVQAHLSLISEISVFTVALVAK